MFSLKKRCDVLFVFQGLSSTFESVFAIFVSTFMSAIWILRKDLNTAYTDPAGDRKFPAFPSEPLVCNYRLPTMELSWHSIDWWPTPDMRNFDPQLNRRYKYLRPRKGQLHWIICFCVSAFFLEVRDIGDPTEFYRVGHLRSCRERIFGCYDSFQWVT